jgi:hypothetical protein
MYRAHILKTWVDQLQAAKDRLDGQWRKLRMDVADGENTIQSLRQPLEELKG